MLYSSMSGSVCIYICVLLLYDEQAMLYSSMSGCVCIYVCYCCMMSGLCESFVMLTLYDGSHVLICKSLQYYILGPLSTPNSIDCSQTRIPSTSTSFTACDNGFL